MTPRVVPGAVDDDRVLPVTHAVSVAIVPFLVVAFVDLFLWPGRTDRYFAWPIKPPVTAMILASVYLGGAYFFVRAARARQWQTIKAGFPPVALFATLMGIATVMHWDRFNHGHIAFWLWAGLYFTTPFLIAGVWLQNRRYAAPAPVEEALVPDVVAKAIGAIGVLAVLMSAFLLLWPAKAIALWPWTLTPLTARALGAIFALGIAALGAVGERRWSAYRLMVQVEAVMLTLILVSALRATADFDGSNALTWLFGLGFLGVLGGSGFLYVRMEAQPR